MSKHTFARPNLWDFLGLLIVSFSCMSFELLIIRCLSLIMWYHFAFMVISIAMLGLGAAGTTIAVFQKTRFFKNNKVPAWSSMFLGLAMVIAVISMTKIHPDMYQLGMKPVELFYLSLLYLVLSLPFFMTGLTVAFLLKETPEYAPRLYGIDLLGAGIGCWTVIPLQEWLGAPRSILLISFLAVLGAGVFAISRKSKVLWLCGMFAMSFLMVSFTESEIFILKPGPDKMLSFFSKNSTSPYRYFFRTAQKKIAVDQMSEYDPAGNWPGIKILKTEWDILCRIDAAAYSDWHPIYGIGAPSSYCGTLPDQIMITQDGDAATFITKHTGDYSKLDFIDHFLYG
ncbi:hypothetical protein JW979_12470, partial [bacterium]|nr:hypothetical protein [candidate division CSSED10-310 bacterium]